jgi:hypothetical protein
MYNRKVKCNQLNAGRCLLFVIVQRLRQKITLLNTILFGILKIVFTFAV